MTPSRAAASQALLLLALWTGGCRSAPKDPEVTAGDLYKPGLVHKKVETIGMLLAEVDRQVDAWSQLTMSARTEEERVRARGLYLNLVRIVKPRADEVIEQLEVGPPINRVRAAAALGFCPGVEEVQSPLLAALYDADAQVVGNALFSLGNLQDPHTPLDRICALAQEHPSGRVRGNAVRAILWVLDAGGSGACALETARVGLTDPEAGVRAQSALVLGILEDGDSVGMIADLLYDEHMFVVRAAARALAALAERVGERRGEAARALVAAYEKADTDARKDLLHLTLVQVNGKDLDELERWVEWARNMP